MKSTCHIQVTNRLTNLSVQVVKSLIYQVWSFESRRSDDVNLLVDDPSSVDEDALNRLSCHFLARYNQQIVGYARLTIFETTGELLSSFPELDVEASKVMLQGPVGYMSRLVVHPHFRSQKIGEALTVKRLEHAFNENTHVKNVIGSVVGKRRQAHLKHFGFSSICDIRSYRNDWYRTTRPVSLMTISREKWINRTHDLERIYLADTERQKEIFLG